MAIGKTTYLSSTNLYDDDLQYSYLILFLLFLNCGSYFENTAHSKDTGPDNNSNYLENIMHEQQCPYYFHSIF